MGATGVRVACGGAALFLVVSAAHAQYIFAPQFPPGAQGPATLPLCKTSHDCRVGSYCTQGRCFPQQPIGSPCCAHDGCALGFCEVGGTGLPYNPRQPPVRFGPPPQVHATDCPQGGYNMAWNPTMGYSPGSGMLFPGAGGAFGGTVMTPGGFAPGQVPTQGGAQQAVWGRCTPFRKRQEYCVSHWDCGFKFNKWHNVAYCDNVRRKEDGTLEPATGAPGTSGTTDPTVPTSRCLAAKMEDEICLEDAQCQTDCCACNVREKTDGESKKQRRAKYCEVSRQQQNKNTFPVFIPIVIAGSLLVLLACWCLFRKYVLHGSRMSDKYAEAVYHMTEIDHTYNAQKHNGRIELQRNPMSYQRQLKYVNP